MVQMPVCFLCPTASINASATVVPLAEEDIFTKCRTEPGSSSAVGAECRLNVLHLSALECQSQQKQMAKKFVRNPNSLDTLGRASMLFSDNVHRKKSKSPEKYKNVGQKITVTADVQRSNDNDEGASAGLPPVDVDVVNQSLSSGYKSRLIDRLASSRYSKLMPKRFIEKSIVNDNDPSSSLSDRKKSKCPDRFRTFFARTMDTLEISSAFTTDSLMIHHHNASDFMESITKECSAADERRHAFCEKDFHVRMERSISHRVMFFIHGVGGCMKIWEHQIRHFHSKGYEIIAMDLIGHGCSELPGLKSRYEFKAIKSDVMLIFDKYSSKLPYKNIVMAHSYGTCFAAVLSRERPNLIGHLILISCGAPVPLVPDGGAFRLPTMLFRLVRPILNYNFRRLAYHIKPSPENFRRAFGMVDSKAVRFIMLGQYWPQGDRIYHQLISAPTLLICGLSDRLVTLDEMNDMRKTIADAHLEVIEQASHMVMQENAGQVNELVDKFLLTVEPDHNDGLCCETLVPIVNKNVDVFRRPTTFRSRHSMSGILSQKSTVAKNKRPKSSGSRLIACRTFKVY